LSSPDNDGGGGVHGGIFELIGLNSIVAVP
jgi:hypothetical protein